MSDRKYQHWESWEVAYLQSHFRQCTYEELGRYLGRDPDTVKAKANKIGLRKVRLVDPGLMKSQVERWPAVYSNRNIREELLNKYAPQ